MSLIQAPYAKMGFGSQMEYEMWKQQQQIAQMQQQEALQAARLSNDMLQQQMNPQTTAPLTGQAYSTAQTDIYRQLRESGQIAPQFRASSDNLTPEQLQAERAAHWQQVNADIAAGKYQYKTAQDAQRAITGYLSEFSQGGLPMGTAPSYQGFTSYGGGGTAGGTGYTAPTNLAGVLGSTGTTGSGLPTTGPAPSVLPGVSPLPGGGSLPTYSTGGGIPAPGTLVPTSFNIGGMYGGTGQDQVALDETKAIYGTAIGTQQGLAGQYANQTAAAQAQMQGTADAYGQREQDLAQYLEGMGDSERANIEARRLQAIEAAKQDLMRRGLTSTTAYDSALRGVENIAAEQMASFEDAMQRKRMDYLSVLSGEKLAAQSGAADFAATQAAQRFAANQTPVQSMTELAQLLAQQRDSAANRAAQLQMSFKDIGLEYAKMQHDAQQSAADRLVSQFQIGQQTGLGYAGISADQQASRLGARTDLATARIAKSPVRFSGGPASPMSGKI